MKIDNSKITVLECFSSYLPNSTNWVFRLLKTFENTNIIITADHFLKNNFYSNKFNYIEFPIKPFKEFNLKKSWYTNILEKLINQIRKYYWVYLKKQLPNVNLVHSHFADTARNYHIFARKLDIPHIISFYGWDYEMLTRIKPEFESHYIKFFDECVGIICEGKHGANILKKKGCPEEKLHIVRLGIETNKVIYNNRNKKANELHLIQVAAFTEKKGHKYSLLAFIDALETSPNMTLTFVGVTKNYIYDTLIKIVDDNKVQSKVNFIESISFDSLHEFLDDYQIFIHPSVHAVNGDCEGGAPVVLLDAQAAGMPIISTFHCDIPEEVIHQKTGLLAQEKDIKTLTQHIHTFYEMEQKEYDTFSKEARRHIEKNYDVIKNSKKLEELYISVIDLN